MKYSYQSPYCFAVNNPISLVDVLGLGPGDEVKKGEGPAAYAKRNGVKLDQLAVSNPGVFKNYNPNGTWTKEQKDSYWKNTKNWSLHPGQVLQLNPIFSVGSLALKSDDLDQEKHTLTESKNTIRYYKYIGNATLDFVSGFKTGTSLKKSSDENSLLKMFSEGTGDNTKVSLSFPSNSGLAGVLASTTEFKNFANSFETQVRNWWNTHGSLSGFNGDEALKQTRPSYMGDLTSRSGLYAFTVMGGYCMLNAEIQLVNANQLMVSYTFTDHFGAGADDSYKWYLPGLPALYYLQHYDNANKTANKPFIWNVNIIRNK